MAAITYPGIYVEEAGEKLRTLIGVASAITAFVGRTPRGPVQLEATTVLHSFAEFTALFGDLDPRFPLTYVVRDYFQNGGGEAVIVRLYAADADSAPVTTARYDCDSLHLSARYPGAWGNHLTFHVTTDIATGLFQLDIVDTVTGVQETFADLTVSGGERDARVVVNEQSALVTITTAVTSLPASGTCAQPNPEAIATDGNKLGPSEYLGDPATETGVYALEKAEAFQLLCIPLDEVADDTDKAAVYAAALEYCVERRAILILDPLADMTTKDSAIAGLATLGLQGESARNAALYFPRVWMADPKRGGAFDTFPACGSIAGVIARTDAERGVWKAPAGPDAELNGVIGLTAQLTDSEHAALNAVGINCLRLFPEQGVLVWGARTLRGDDAIADEYKYLPVRRLALTIEENLRRSLQWAVFEPNDEPLRARIRLDAGMFLHRLFQQGAFAGAAPQEAYFVRCDGGNNPTADSERGLVRVLIGFAPLKVSEFVLIELLLNAGTAGK